MKQVLGGAALALAFSLFAYTLYLTAWLSEDAYISYRVVDNLVNGLGLTWNPVERVQVFTNPLWVLLNVPGHLLSNAPWQIYFSGLATSAAVSLLAVAVLAAGVAATPALAVLAILVLTFSRAFVDYSTSGLENPATHLLLAICMVLAMRQRWGTGTIFGMALCAGLSMVNRLDTALLFAPLLGYAWLAERNLRATLALAAGLLPLLAWLAFAIIYYGFPFPNTAYAKLGTGISDWEVLRQGLMYAINAVRTDPLVPVVLAAGLIGAPLALREGKYTALALGGLLYCAYVVKIGGDFMQGRFWAAPLFVAVLLAARVARAGSWPLCTAAAIGAIGLSALAPDIPLFAPATGGNKEFDAYRIADERMFYMRATGFRNWRPGTEFPRHQYADKGRSLRATGRYQQESFQSIGFRGYFAGPRTFIIDQYALGDPLLARLPALFNPRWRIGHFTRTVPNWYRQRKAAMMSALQAQAGEAPGALNVDAARAVAPLAEAATVPAEGPTDIDNDPALIRYYDALERIIRGPIWDKARWQAILDMNLGRLDDLVDTDAYRFARMQRAALADVSSPKEEGTTWNAPGTRILPSTGLEIQLGQKEHRSLIELSADHNDEYCLLFMQGKDIVGEARFGTDETKRRGLRVRQVTVPNAAIRAGYDAIRIFPYLGDGKSSLGHLRLL